MVGTSKKKVARPRRITRVICRCRCNIRADTIYVAKDEISAEAARRDIDSVVIAPNTNEAVCAPGAEYAIKATKYRAVLYAAHKAGK
jgi:hypothetical protein